MREIKFRHVKIINDLASIVYNPTLYYAETRIEKSITAPTITTYQFIEVNKIFEEEGAIYNQYTGINDKLGTEIYEGDIVLTDFKKEEVHWDRFAWFVGENFTDATGEAYQVIGNIYENPELLK